ncbi:hypothetical protein MNBD_GAMMA08-2694 [hydrothermal vent metagenome]|uniref:Coenzyme Q-binding protein COQ10 START domain-containing protein n=1 Tax=hydrothermal vent metagenome TaxID=652676 RepID=A0A3B0YG55_9ZZZZ
MKRSAIIFLILISFIGGIVWYGNTLPELSHTSSSQIFNHHPSHVWQLLFDFERYPEWRENVYAVEKIPSKTNLKAWKEIDEDGNTLSYEIVEYELGVFIVIHETGDAQKNFIKLRFDIEVTDDEKSTILKITEDRIVPQLLPRVINHLLNTSPENVNAYFRSIHNKFKGDAIRAKKNAPAQSKPTENMPTENINEKSDARSADTPQ